MNIKRLFVLGILLIAFIFVFISPKSIKAQQGCCSYHGGISYCDTSIGRYVCSDGSYSPSCGCYRYNPVPTFPAMTANWDAQPNSSPNKTFTVRVTLNDDNPTQYSAILSKCMGCNPGPLTDFYSNQFTYINVAPGTWYLDVKKNIGGTWSTISYWTLTIPQWYEPLPTPTPVPVITTPPLNPPSGDNLIADGIVIVVVFVVGVIGLLIFIAIIKRFISYSKEHDWVWGALFWGVVILIAILASVFSNKNNKTSIIKPTNYICNCSKTCPNMTCTEAYFQLNECGCSARDGDGDGVPCEAQCR